MQQETNNPYPLMISVVVTSAAQLASVYALLGGAALNALVTTPGNVSKDVAKPATAPATVGSETLAQEEPESAGTGPNATTDASPSDGEIDAHGHPWSADLHASTKGKTKDGLWRMKVGVTRPDPLPGFPVANDTDTGTKSAGTEASPGPSATSQDAVEPGTGQPSTSPAPAEEDDEFAAFRAAAATSDAADQAAAAAVPPRAYTDADLGALCNQAAVKLGDPSPIKEIIAKFVPSGEVAHSRNIPEDKRAEFVSEVEAKAGVQFAG